MTCTCIYHLQVYEELTTFYQKNGSPVVGALVTILESVIETQTGKK